MKSSYTAPKLTVHGDVAEITQLSGTSSRRDFLFVGGTIDQAVANAPDQGSQDLCVGTPPSDPNARCRQF
jgi:hypothetical protein